MSGEATIPQVGETVIWDGEAHQITAVAERTLDFTDGAAARTVALHDLERTESGAWGVIGRTAKRPASQRLGVKLEPTAPTGEG